MKKVVYTCVTNQIDDLKDPKVIEEDCRYLCYTDHPKSSHVWNFLPLLKKFNCPRLTSRYHKTIGANKINADITIWQDGKVQFVKGHSHLFQQEFCVQQHPKRNCVYQEAIRVIHLRKCDPRIVKKQTERYQKEGFPVEFGLYETSVLVRSKRFMNLNEKWWHEIQNNSIRDQISLPYILWKLSITPKKLDPNLIETIEHPFTDYYKRISLL